MYMHLSHYLLCSLSNSYFNLGILRCESSPEAFSKFHYERDVYSILKPRWLKIAR